MLVDDVRCRQTSKENNVYAYVIFTSFAFEKRVQYQWKRCLQLRKLWWKASEVCMNFRIKSLFPKNSSVLVVYLSVFTRKGWFKISVLKKYFGWDLYFLYMFQNMFTSLVQVAIISFTSWLQKSHFDMSCYSHLLMDLQFLGPKKFLWSCLSFFVLAFCWNRKNLALRSNNFVQVMDLVI